MRRWDALLGTAKTVEQTVPRYVLPCITENEATRRRHECRSTGRTHDDRSPRVVSHGKAVALGRQPASKVNQNKTGCNVSRPLLRAPDCDTITTLFGNIACVSMFTLQPTRSLLFRTEVYFEYVFCFSLSKYFETHLPSRPSRRGTFLGTSLGSLDMYISVLLSFPKYPN